MIVIGAILGWLAAILLRIELPRGILLNISAGILGALVMGILVSPMLLGGGSLLGGYYQVGAILMSLVGSVVLIAALNVFWPRKLR